MITWTALNSNNKAAKNLVMQWATVEDRAQASQKQHKTVRENFLLTRAVLRCLLAHVTGVSVWVILSNANGKPQAFTRDGVVGPHITLFHTHGLVGCAASYEGPIGIDAEYWRQRNFVAIADYAFGAREQEEVAREGISAFYRIWTLKEAIAKATGKGLIANIDGLDHVAGGPASGCWASGKWQLFNTSFFPDYSLALATQNHVSWSEASVKRIDLSTHH